MKDWKAEQTIINGVAVTTGTDSSDVDLETIAMDGAHVTVSATFPTNNLGGKVVNLVVEVLGSLDGANYDTVPLQSRTITNDYTSKQISFLVKDVAHFKLHCYRTGAEDTVTVIAKCQRYNFVV